MVFSASLEEPLTWANSTLVRDDAVEAVRAMKENGSGLISSIGSISLCRSLLRAGLVDRFRVVMFPVITGATGAERIYDGYPDVALEMIDNRTFDGRIQLVEYRPRSSRTRPSTPPREQSTAESGAVVMGRRLFDVVNGPDGWNDEMGTAPIRRDAAVHRRHPLARRSPDREAGDRADAA